MISKLFWSRRPVNCSEAHVQKCSPEEVLCNSIEITLHCGCSPVNLVYIFRAPFPKNTSGRLLHIVEPLIKSGWLKFNIRYVNDALLLAKKQDMNCSFHEFNLFWNSVKFKIGRFEENKLCFLDITIDKTDTDNNPAH